MKARELSNLLGPFGKKIVGDELSPRRIQQELQDTDVLINATSAGMYPNASESLVKPSWLKTSLCVMDIVYNPNETKLVQEAKAVGAKVITGVEMLLHQGAASFEIWTQCKAPIDVMRNALLSRLPNKGGPV
jgi:shikimate dehydrogenase